MVKGDLYPFRLHPTLLTGEPIRRHRVMRTHAREEFPLLKISAQMYEKEIELRYLQTFPKATLT